MATLLLVGVLILALIELALLVIVLLAPAADDADGSDNDSIYTRSPHGR